jgi:hypothetical protein
MRFSSDPKNAPSALRHGRKNDADPLCLLRGKRQINARQAKALSVQFGVSAAAFI